MQAGLLYRPRDMRMVQPHSTQVLWIRYRTESCTRLCHDTVWHPIASLRLLVTYSPLCHRASVSYDLIPGMKLFVNSLRPLHLWRLFGSGPRAAVFCRRKPCLSPQFESTPPRTRRHSAYALPQSLPQSPPSYCQCIALERACKKVSIYLRLIFCSHC